MVNKITENLLATSSEALKELEKVETQAKLKSKIDLHYAQRKIYKDLNLYKLEPLELFIDKCISKDSDEQQKYSKRDSQYDNLCTTLNNLQNGEIILVDFGCGPYLNLLQQITDYQESDTFSSLINYFAIDEYSEVNEIFQYDSLISKLPNFIENVYKISKLNGIMLFYDLSEVSEPFNFPWDFELYKNIFEDTLGCNIKYTPFSATQKRTALHMCLIEKTSNNFISKGNLRIKLINIFNDRINRLLEIKRKIINGDRELQYVDDDQKRLEFIKTVIYHSNIEYQIRNAKKEWNL